MRKVLADEEGQVVVEYILSLLLAIFVIGLVAASFRKTIFSVWTSFTRDIAAACPGCPTDGRYRLR
jgi:Flp pilus assembly pilin Flp